MPTIAIVDDHELIAETLRLALVGAGLDAERVQPRPIDELRDALLDARPGLVLLDLDLGEYGDTTRLIGPLVDAGIRVLLVTGVPDRLRVAAALEQGALGYQPKAAGFAALLDKARTALVSDVPLDLEERWRLLADLTRDRTERGRVLAPFLRLTQREQHTLAALAQGRSVHDLARAWVVSEATVRTHVRGVLTKLGAPSQLAAVAIAINCGWLQTSSARSPGL